MSDRSPVRPVAPWGLGEDYLLAACLAATGAASVAGRFLLGFAASAAFVLGFAASAVRRAFGGDPRRTAFQGVAVVA